MAYASNYYNYQVAVIFAIVIAAMLLLAGVVGAIYFICVVNMRKKKGFSRAPSAMGRYGGWPPQHEPQQVITAQQPPYTDSQPQQGVDYQRSQPSPYSTAAAMTYGGQQPQQQYSQQYAQPPQQSHQYTQQPQQQQYLQSQQADPRIRDIHAEYAYQQGPITWSTTTPVAGGYVAGPQILTTTQGYHMSSV